MLFLSYEMLSLGNRNLVLPFVAVFLTFDFSTLFITLPRDMLKTVLRDVILFADTKQGTNRCADLV